ncbi:unnamed protein product [Ectocarpus sp. CCAP 1310/34]|nr:unnamed protein product [Ectocarpus sp. CCAP 1310/34]
MLGSGKHCKHYKDAKALRLDVAAMLSAAGRSFHSGKGGDRQKKYICNGAAGGCQVTVRACRQRSREFKVTFFIPGHNDCSGGEVGAIAAALEGFASANMVSTLTMKGTDLKRSLEQSTGLRVSYSTASRLKVAAARASNEQLEHGYRIMDSYCKELVKDCPGSVAVVERETTGRFRSVFVMLRRAAHAAVRSPMKVVGMDGGHLKGEWNGMMLTLTCKDANNENIHVAAVIGPKEDTSLYNTLLRNCKKNPKMRDLLEDSKTTFFTDQHKEATCALRGEAPLAQHRHCLRHLILNIEEKIGSKMLRLEEHELRYERRAGEGKEEMRHALVAAGVGRGGEAGKPAAAGSEQGGHRLQQPQRSVQPHQQQPSHYCQLHGPNSTHETSECHKLLNEFLAHYNEFCAYMSGRREAQGSVFPRGGAQDSGGMVGGRGGDYPPPNVPPAQIANVPRPFFPAHFAIGGGEPSGGDITSGWEATSAPGSTPSWTPPPPEAGYGYGLAAHGVDHGGGPYGSAAGGGHGFHPFPDGGGLYQQQEVSNVPHYPSAAGPDAQQPRVYEAFDTSQQHEQQQHYGAPQTTSSSSSLSPAPGDALRPAGDPPLHLFVARGVCPRGKSEIGFEKDVGFSKSDVFTSAESHVSMPGVPRVPAVHERSDDEFGVMKFGVSS